MFFGDRTRVMHFDCTKRDRGLVLETASSSYKDSKQWKSLPRKVVEYPSLLVSKNTGQM